ERLREKVLDFCTKKSWRLSSHDTGTEEPNFDELRQFIIGKAQLVQKQIVYNKEKAIREGIVESNASVDAKGPSSQPATTSPTPDPAIAELTKQFSQLTLLLQASLNQPRGPSPGAANAPSRISNPRPFGDRQPRCLWCDATDHIRKFC